MTVAQLFARIGLKADTDKAEQFRTSVKGIVAELKVAAVGSLAFGAAVAASMRGALETAKEFRQFQAETGASADELQRWQAVASGASVSTQAIADSVKELAQNREKIKLGGGNTTGFAFLGINPMDDPFKILEQLKARTQGLPQAMKANLLAQMGVSSQFLQILNLTNAQFAEMRSNAFVIPQSALDSLGRVQGSINLLGNAAKWFQALMAERLAPTIDRVVRSVTSWIKANKDGLINGILEGTKLLLKFFEAVVTVATWIGRIITATIGWKGAFDVLLIALAYFNRALLMSPIGLIIGGILLLVAVLDDLHAAFGVDGDKRESFFGSIFKKFPEVKKSFEDTFGFLKDLGAVISGLFGGDQKAFDSVIAKWGDWGKIILEVRDAVKFLIENLAAFAKTMAKGLISGDWKGFDELMKKWGALGTVLKTIKESMQWLIENMGRVFAGSAKDLAAIDSLSKGDPKKAEEQVKLWIEANFGRGLYGLLGPQLSELFGVKDESRTVGTGGPAGSELSRLLQKDGEAKKAVSSPQAQPAQKAPGVSLEVKNVSTGPIETTVETRPKSGMPSDIQANRYGR